MLDRNEQLTSNPFHGGTMYFNQRVKNKRMQKMFDTEGLLFRIPYAVAL